MKRPQCQVDKAGVDLSLACVIIAFMSCGTKPRLVLVQAELLAVFPRNGSLHQCRRSFDPSGRILPLITLAARSCSKKGTDALMVLKEFRCTRCGNRFEVQCLDREDPRERDEPGDPIRCPNPSCRSQFVELIRTIRRG